jgi:hypothetical protein
MLRSVPGNSAPGPSLPVTDPKELENFYGRENSLRVRYVREKTRVDYGKAHDDEYQFELLEHRK